MSLLEACVGSYASSKAAYQGGADRLELCANLVIGGTTPSRALFLQVQRDFDIRINVMIRTRFGDFLYDDAELEEMCAEIASFRDLGANGVVFGVLTPEGELDEARMARLISCAGNMEVTLDARPLCGAGIGNSPRLQDHPDLRSGGRCYAGKRAPA